MADSIVTRLGFDASAAIQSLQQLNSALASTGASLEGFSSKLGSFNSQATASVSSLRSMARAANTTAKAFERLNATRNTTSPTAQPAKPNPGILPSGSTTNIKAGTAAAQQAFQRLGTSGTQSVASLTVSWETLGRVVMTQAIVRALSMIRNAMSDAMQSSIAFGNGRNRPPAPA